MLYISYYLISPRGMSRPDKNTRHVASGGPTVTYQSRRDHPWEPNDHGDHFVITYDHSHDHSDQPLGTSDQGKIPKYIEHAHCTFLCRSYLSYQYNLVTLNTLEHITRRNLHPVQDNATFSTANINPARPVYPLGTHMIVTRNIISLPIRSSPFFSFLLRASNKESSSLIKLNLLLIL
jgi:hypothetical protein